MEEEWKAEELAGLVYEAARIILRALEFNANCVIASYNTSDADRKACMDHAADVYDMFYTELDDMVELESEDEDEDYELEEEEEDK